MNKRQPAPSPAPGDAAEYRGVPLRIPLANPSFRGLKGGAGSAGPIPPRRLLLRRRPLVSGAGNVFYLQKPLKHRFEQHSLSRVQASPRGRQAQSGSLPESQVGPQQLSAMPQVGHTLSQYAEQVPAL